MSARVARERLVLAVGDALAYRARYWDGAYAVLERGELELEGHSGRRLRLTAGAVLGLQDVSLRLIRNVGEGDAVVAIARRE